MFRKTHSCFSCRKHHNRYLSEKQGIAPTDHRSRCRKEELRLKTCCLELENVEINWCDAKRSRRRASRKSYGREKILGTRLHKRCIITCCIRSDQSSQWNSGSVNWGKASQQWYLVIAFVFKSNNYQLWNIRFKATTCAVCAFQCNSSKPKSERHPNAIRKQHQQSAQSSTMPNCLF